MKHLLKPAESPPPDLLHRQLGLAASTFKWRDRQEAVARKSSILARLQALVGSDKLTPQAAHGGVGDSFYEVYELDSASSGICYGSASFTYMPLQQQKGSLGARLSWEAVGQDVDRTVAAIDAIWRDGSFSGLYAYDEDDCGLQNMTMPFGIGHWGIGEEQITVVRQGGVDEIDTSHNPGHMVNRDGLIVSVQWLNYWDENAQKVLFGGRPGRLPTGVDVADLGDGAIRVRLGKTPGRFDDVKFHERQLETRRCLRLSE